MKNKRMMTTLFVLWGSLLIWFSAWAAWKVVHTKYIEGSIYLAIACAVTKAFDYLCTKQLKRQEGDNE